MVGQYFAKSPFFNKKKKKKHREVRAEMLFRTGLLGGGEGEVKGEFKDWENFCESRGTRGG